MMISKKAEQVLLYLNEILPNVGCELNYHKDYELLIAVVLSAQTTDKSVNQVTPTLFSKYQSLEELANADIKEVEDIVKSIGLYKAKAKNIVNLAKELVEKYESKVPSGKEVLVTLPGVGNKTAGVTRLELFKADELPVDTHVARIAKRIKFANKNDEPIDIEKKLKKAFTQDSFIINSFTLVDIIVQRRIQNVKTAKFASFASKNS